MKKVIYNVIFNRKKKLNTMGESLIQIEAYYEKRKIYFSTKIYIKPTQWDKKKKCIKNHPNKDGLNNKIRDFITELEGKELKVWKNGNGFQLADLKKKCIIPGSQSFITFYKEEIDHAILKESTKKNHLSTLALIKSYNENLQFDNITFEFLCGFEHFLINKGFHRNTIAKHLKHIKRYINNAINKDLFDIYRYPFRKFRIKQIETFRNYLTPEELYKLENINLACFHPRYQHVLDAFLFSCYTGLRYSDIIKLKFENIFSLDNQFWLIYSTTKTGKKIKLPLSLLFEGKGLLLLEKYKKDADVIFPLPDNSNVNKLLKKICTYAEINKKISFHSARHTNATLLLYNGANITTVQKILGHKSIKTTQIYGDIMDMTVVRDLEKIRKNYENS